MKAVLTLVALALLTSITYPTFIDTDDKSGETKQLPSIEEAIAQQKEVCKSAEDNLRSTVAGIRSQRDTIVENVVVTEVRVDTILQEIHDTIEVIKPEYKTITRSIYVGNQFNHTNNLKIDTSK